MRIKCVNGTCKTLKTVTGTEVTPPAFRLKPFELSFNAAPSRQTSYLGLYLVDELVECEVDQAVLQEGSGPTQVIGAVARHVGQTPGRQMGRQARAWGPGLHPRAEAQLPGGGLGIKHSCWEGPWQFQVPCRAPCREPREAEPAASC